MALDPSLDHCVFVLLFQKNQEMAVRQRIEANPYDTEAWTELAQEAQVPIFCVNLWWHCSGTILPWEYPLRCVLLWQFLIKVAFGLSRLMLNRQIFCCPIALHRCRRMRIDFVGLALVGSAGTGSICHSGATRGHVSNSCKSSQVQLPRENQLQTRSVGTFSDT